MEQHSEGLHSQTSSVPHGDRPVAQSHDNNSSPPVVATEIYTPENKLQTSEPIEESLLQELLANLVFSSGHQPDFTPLEQKITQLEHQLYDPEEVINLLMPIISDLLNRKVMESKDSIIRAIVPIIDEVIVEKTEEDKAAMIKAISALIPGAIDQQVRSSSDDLVEALAPAMGEIIKQQIRIERDAMVDALYPVIGSTISKYMQEVVQEINNRVESTLTPAGIQRKIRAKMKGVSEAELIFQESMPFQIKAIFLIHKQSGLIIASAKPENKTQTEEKALEGDLMAGMLTAMRSFASECAIEPGNTSELKEIEYESFQILMEVAGYCYMATIIQGQVDQSYIKNMRQTLANIILNYDQDKSIHYFSGDPSSIDVAVQEELENLIEYRPKSITSKPTFPIALLSLLLVPFLAWGGWRMWRGHQLKALAAIESKIDLELNSDPQLAVYPVESEAHKNWGDRQIILSGKVPSFRLREKAQEIADEQLTLLDEPTEWEVINEIITVEVEPDSDVVAAEVERLTEILNKDEDIIIMTRYGDRQVTISGHLRTEEKLQQITDSFNEIPGVDNILVASTTKAFPIDQRLYFGTNDAAVSPNDAQEKLTSVNEFLRQYPEMRLQIIGHVHPSETQQDDNSSLAQKRAIAVQQGLVTLGIDPNRLEIIAAPSAPPNLTQADSAWLSRSVRFERIMEQ